MMELGEVMSIAIDRREELETKLRETLTSVNGIERVIEQSNIEIQELTQELEEKQNQTTELNRDIQLTNSYAEERRLRRRITNIKIASRNIKQNLNTRKVTIQRNDESLRNLTESIALDTEKVAIYTQLINDLVELDNQELMEGIITLVLGYQEHPEVLEVFNKIIDLVNFRIREYVDAQIQGLKEKFPEDPTSLDQAIQRYNALLATPNISIELSRICFRFLDINCIRHPDLKQELQIIENYKIQNPTWWFNDHKSVLNRYIPLRQRFGLITQEINDLEIVLKSMVKDLQTWASEGQTKWVLKRSNDMENLIKKYIHIYPQIRVFLKPINFHRSRIK